MEQLLLEASLAKYPQTVPAIIPLTVTYRTCRSTNFKILPLKDLVYFLGATPIVVSYELVQAPCDYPVGDWRMYLVNTEGKEIPLPTFITTKDPATPWMLIETDRSEFIGKYKLRCYGSILRRGKVVDSAYTDFSLLVLPVQKSVSPNDTPTAPQWDLGL